MKILLLGKNGQVGWELQRTLAPLGNVIALGRKALDLTDIVAIRKVVRQNKPDIIVNAAAYTAVNKAEEEPELAMIVNAQAPGILAEEAVLNNSVLIHYSTDYVFDGTKNSPYTESDEPNPINIYGKTKLKGEKAIQETGATYFILRLSWVYGLRGKNFLRTILRLAEERDELSIVNDQVGSPTWSRMIAESTALILAQGPFEKNRIGIYHLSSAGQASWHEFAKNILTLSGLEQSKQLLLKAIDTEEYPTLAIRPKNSVMDNGLLEEKFGLTLPDWFTSLKLVMDCLL